MIKELEFIVSFIDDAKNPDFKYLSNGKGTKILIHNKMLKEFEITQGYSGNFEVKFSKVRETKSGKKYDIYKFISSFPLVYKKIDKEEETKGELLTKIKELEFKIKKLELENELLKKNQKEIVKEEIKEEIKIEFEEENIEELQKLLYSNNKENEENMLF